MYNKYKKRFPFWLIIWSTVFLLTCVLAISLGASSVSISRIIPTFLGEGTFKEEFVIFSVRLPRLAVLAIAGSALALSGAILQTLTRNDLADPGIIGINAGAGIGVTVFYIYAGGGLANQPYMLPLVGFMSAILAAGLITFLAMERHAGVNPMKLVLIGIGFAFALSGLMTILMSSADRTDVQFIAAWLSGNVWGADWPYVWALLPWIVIAVPVSLWKAKRLNIMRLEDSVGKGLGIHFKRERAILLILAVALAASSVSVVGSVSFIGLIAPHIAKQMAGVQHQRFLPISMLVGASLLVGADTIGRVLYSEATIPAGVIVALIGAPYFVYLLRKAL